MVPAAITVFVVSLGGIIGLLGLRHWEHARGVRVAPGARARADERALELKELLFWSRTELLRLWPLVIRLIRVIIHQAALGLAALARALERGAHRLADLVSYKHSFEHRESTNEFLK